LVRTSIPDVSLSNMEDPDKWPMVRAFRAQVAREVRAAALPSQRMAAMTITVSIYRVTIYRIRWASMREGGGLVT
jgi:hypothetical protein